ncbi:uncharacterized protein LOC144631321 [Oculina patagonica]
MGSCMSMICQCHLCRCYECGPCCFCCRCCKRWFGDWWMCSDCCDEFTDEEYSPVNPRKGEAPPPDDGEGMYKYPNGDVYVGEWRRGKRHGYGELVKKDGTQTVGFFYDDEYVGEKPDDRLRRSPVTSRPFSKSQSGQNDSAGPRKEDQEAIELAWKEEKQRINSDASGSQSYSAIKNGHD